jgi:hypothetical protein
LIRHAVIGFRLFGAPAIFPRHQMDAGFIQGQSLVEIGAVLTDAVAPAAGMGVGSAS